VAPANAAAPAAAAASSPPDATVATGPLRRNHLVYGFGLVEQENLHLQKLAIDLDANDTVAGGGAGFWVNPIWGLVISGEGDYHDHKGIVDQEKLFPNQEILVAEARYSADFEVGWNLLDPFGIRSQALTLSFASASTQLPLVSLTYKTDAAHPPGFDRRIESLYGGAVSYAYLGEGASVTLEGGLLVEPSDDATMSFERVLLDLYPTDYISLEFGLLHRMTELSRCSPDKALCLSEGEAHTTIEETGGLIGIGLALMGQ